MGLFSSIGSFVSSAASAVGSFLSGSSSSSGGDEIETMAVHIQRRLLQALQ